MAGKNKLNDTLKGQVRPRGGRQPDRIDVAAAPASEPMKEPTPEQMARVEYQRGPVQLESGAFFGFAYRRRPLIETLGKTLKGIDSSDLAALRAYRNVFDRCERSATKSCLDVGPGGGRGGNTAENRIVSATPAMIDAKRRLEAMERAIGNVVTTMRDVALYDRSFSEIAIGRFGGRVKSYIVDEHPVRAMSGKPMGRVRKEHREKLEPKSGRHRELISEEFMTGTRRLAAFVHGYSTIAGSMRPPTSVTTDQSMSICATIDAALDRSLAQGVEPVALWASPSVIALIARENDVAADEVPTVYRSIPIMERAGWAWGWVLSSAAQQGSAELWVETTEGGTATIRRGAAAPIGVYRAWGLSVAVDRAWLELVAAHGEALAFRSIPLAIEALDRVAAECLNRLGSDELAA